MANDFLYTKNGNIEFWTRKSDGESAVSAVGLARMCGVTHPAILKLLKNIENDSVTWKGTKHLKALRGQVLYFVTSPKKQGKQVKGISGFHLDTK